LIYFSLLSIGSSVEVTILELAKEVARLIDAKVEVIPTVSPPDWYVAENQETMNTLAVKETKSWEESIIELVQKV
jgi:cell division protein FtsI/penicillin-binding protein 2